EIQKSVTERARRLRFAIDGSRIIQKCQFIIQEDRLSGVIDAVAATQNRSGEGRYLIAETHRGREVVPLIGIERLWIRRVLPDRVDLRQRPAAGARLPLRAPVLARYSERAGLTAHSIRKKAFGVI